MPRSHKLFFKTKFKLSICKWTWKAWKLPEPIEFSVVNEKKKLNKSKWEKQNRAKTVEKKCCFRKKNYLEKNLI